VTEREHSGSLGCLLGVVVAAVAVGLMVPWAVSSGTRAGDFSLTAFPVLAISTTAVGYVAAIGLTTRRSTSWMGFNMLVGLTMGLPVLAFFTFMYLWVTSEDLGASRDRYTGLTDEVTVRYEAG